MNQEPGLHQLGLHLRMTLIVPPTIPRPLPTEMELIIDLGPLTSAADLDQVIASTSKLLDSYAQAIQAHQLQTKEEEAK